MRRRRIYWLLNYYDYDVIPYGQHRQAVDGVVNIPPHLLIERAKKAENKNREILEDLLLHTFDLFSFAALQ